MLLLLKNLWRRVIYLYSLSHFDFIHVADFKPIIALRDIKKTNHKLKRIIRKNYVILLHYINISV